jgi:hypothetical protein
MIRYALRCHDGHDFESWFRSAEAFDALQAAGHLSCPGCGSNTVEKALMAPRVRPARKAATRPQDEGHEVPAAGSAAPPAGGPLSRPSTAQEAALAELRRKIEANSEYVGLSFATEARRIHAGEAPERPIHGEARLDEARALLDEGVPVAPLPFLPARKAN